MKNTKQVKRFRVKVGNNYCSLNNTFAPLGVCIPDSSMEAAHVFTSMNGANNAISRTVEAQRLARESMFPEFKVFKPLYFKGAPEAEEFLVDSES